MRPDHPVVKKGGLSQLWEGLLEKPLDAHGLHMHPKQRPDLASRQTQILTDSAKDESPSFAPNGRMILYASEIGGRGVLAAVSSDGRVKQKLSVQAADVREPAWGPFLKQ